MRSLKTIKHRLYYYFAEKNWGVRREYGPYVDAHQEDHHSHRWKHWWLLIRLNWHYRILRSSKPLLKSQNPAVKPSARPKPGVPFFPKAESEKRNWPKAYHLAKALLKYDVISFDIFDTLLLRKLNGPVDLFSIVGNKLNNWDFYSLRRQAEREVRALRAEQGFSTEITLYDIYDRIALYTGIDPKYGAEVEFGVECDICFANPYLHQVYSMLKAMGKTVVATSDMYLPKDKMKKLLGICGYEDLDDVLVSCDYLCNKGDKGLFDILKEKYHDSCIVHIGDNWIHDIVNARSCGIDARHYVACRALGDLHRCVGMSPMIQSAYRGIINSTLHSGDRTYSRAWEYGFIYGGLSAFAYVHWIHENAIKDGVTKLLFTARDGYIFKKIFDNIYNDIPSEYVYWSRSAAIRGGLNEDRSYRLSHFLSRRVDSGETINDALDICKIKSFGRVFKQYQIDLDEKITSENIGQLTEIVLENIDEYDQAFQSQIEYTEKYLNSVVGNHKKIGIVDLGFSGKNTSVLKRHLQGLGLKRSDISLYLMGNVVLWDTCDAVLSQNIKIFMFDYGLNTAVTSRLISTGRYGCAVFEKMYGAPHPSFMGFGNHGEMEFAPLESENVPIIIELQRGIMEFCNRYHNMFFNYPELFNISASDAAQSMIQLLNYPKAAELAVGKMVQVFRVSVKDQDTLASTVKK